MTWWEYVVRTSGTTSPKEMADRTGIDAPSFSKWKSGAIPKAETAARFARAYNANVLAAFVAADFLTPEEAGERPAGRPSLGDFTGDELIEEMRRRLHDFTPRDRSKPDPDEDLPPSDWRRRNMIAAAQPVTQAAGTTSQRKPDPDPESQDDGTMEPA